MNSSALSRDSHDMRIVTLLRAVRIAVDGMARAPEPRPLGLVLVERRLPLVEVAHGVLNDDVHRGYLSVARGAARQSGPENAAA